MDEQFTDNIQEFFKNLPKNFNILEDQIDVSIQLEYFEASRNIKKELGDENEIIAGSVLLFQSDYPVNEKKIILQKLASIDKPEAFRIIEKYCLQPDDLIKDWAKLALYESRTLLQSSFLDENQVLISTGLGGKGTKLRFFTVFFSRSKDGFSDNQFKLVNSELNFGLSQNDGTVEQIELSKNFIKILSLMPFKQNIQEVFRNIVKECNNCGDFINEKFLITNVKALSDAEIEEFLKQKDS